MKENETNVAAAPSSQEPAKTAATEHVDELAGGAPGAAIAEAKETPVSTAAATVFVFPHDQREAIVEILRDFLLVNPPTIGIKQMEELTDRVGLLVKDLTKDVEGEAIALAKEYTDSAVDNAKADMVKHLTALVTPIVAAIAPSPVGPHELAVGDPVKVWVDKRANTFRLGEIAVIHDGAHAFDVKLDDGTTTKIPADGLEFDDRR